MTHQIDRFLQEKKVRLFLEMPTYMFPSNGTNTPIQLGIGQQGGVGLEAGWEGTNEIKCIKQEQPSFQTHEMLTVMIDLTLFIILIAVGIFIVY